MKQGVRQWARAEAGQRLASRLEVERKAGRLAAGLRQADHWLEVSEASVESVQRALALGNSLSAPVDASLADPFREKLASLRSRLRQATETVDAVRERSAEIAEGKPPGERIEQLVQLALRVAATLGEVDARLGEFAAGVSATRDSARRLQSQTHLAIVAAQVVAVLLLVWMAAGQACLCRHGWNDFRRSPPPG